LKNFAEFYSFDLEIIHESLMKELDDRQDANLLELESSVGQFSR
jgi:hypothetical protein